MKSENAVCDLLRGTLRCLVCGDEVPMPLGDVAWVCDVAKAFARAHRGGKHAGKRTLLMKRG